MKGVLRHLALIHSHEADFRVICGINGCSRNYSNYHSYKKHMYQRHREVLESGVIRPEPELQSVEPT